MSHKEVSGKADAGSILYTVSAFTFFSFDLGIYLGDLKRLHEYCNLTWQEEAKRVAEQMRALEETRARMTADLGAREAALAQREDAAVVAARKREDDLRRRSAQDEQVSLLLRCICQCQKLTADLPSMIGSVVAAAGMWAMSMPALHGARHMPDYSGKVERVCWDC